MPKISREEKSPLLFVVDSSEDIPRSRYFDRSRFNGITTGATEVFTHFPNYIGTCWITTAICALIFFMMILLVLSTLTAVSLRVPRCVATSEPMNNTIHLVHIHNPKYPELEQVKFIKELMSRYPHYNIRILGITNKVLKRYKDDDDNNTIKVDESNISSSSVATTVVHKKKVPKKRRDMVDFHDTFIDMLLRGKFFEKSDILKAFPTETTTKTATTTEELIDTVEELSAEYPNITYINTTFNQQLYSSPLYPYFRFMNDKVKIFAVRVIQIWQSGGISYDMQASEYNLKEIALDDTGKIQSFVISEKNTPENKSNPTEDEVVSVDDKALHLESKVPCHAFFGQILMLLKKAEQHTSVNEIMQVAIKSFCQHYHIGSQYCHMYMTI